MHILLNVSISVIRSLMLFQFIYTYFPDWLVWFVGIGLVLPLIWTFFDLAFAKKKTQYHRISTVLKVVMLNGVLLLLFANL